MFLHAIPRNLREDFHNRNEGHDEAANHRIITSDAIKYYDCYISLPEHDPPLTVTIGMESATYKGEMEYGSDLLPIKDEVNVRAEPKHDSALVFTYNPAPHQKSSGWSTKDVQQTGSGRIIFCMRGTLSERLQTVNMTAGSGRIWSGARHLTTVPGIFILT